MAAGKELEPKLLVGLMFLKVNTLKTREAADATFGQLNASNPEQVLPALALGWIRFQQQGYQAGVDMLADGVSRIPALKNPNATHPEVLQHTFQWLGQLREFAATAANTSPGARRASEDSLKALDAAIAGRGGDAQQFYDKGRTQTQDKVQDFDQKIAAATKKNDDATAATLRIHRWQLPNYAQFPVGDAAKPILEDWTSSCRAVLACLHARAAAARILPGASTRPATTTARARAPVPRSPSTVCLITTPEGGPIRCCAEAAVSRCLFGCS